jgi:hypothetical protein
MPESRTVALLGEFHVASQAQDGEKMASMLHPDLPYWISPGLALLGNHDRPDLLALLPPTFDARAGPSTLISREVTPKRSLSSVADSIMPLMVGGVSKTVGAAKQEAVAISVVNA